MIYPRLKLARNLLTDDGVIFISIDDNEFSNLKKICDEIFNEVNFIENFLWNKSSGGSSLSKFTRKDYEYVLCYAKNVEKISDKFIGSISEGMGDSSLINQPNKYSKLFFPKNSITFTNRINGHINKFKDNNFELHDDLEISNSKNLNDINISSKWKWSQEYLDNELSNGTQIISKSDNLRLRYIKDNKGSIIPPTKSITEKDNVGYTVSGSAEIVSLLGKGFFDYPKPTSLVKYLINMVTDKDALIFDFFSGSSSTAQATIQLNSEDGGNRKFILVQIGEGTSEKSESYKAGYKTIAEIGKERIRRAGDKIKSENFDETFVSKVVRNLGNEVSVSKSFLDIGFKVFKLDSSNLKKWDPDYKDPEQSILTSIDNIKDDRTEFDLLYEIMLKYGIDLTLEIKEYDIANKKIYSVGFGALLICLDDEITSEIAIEIIKLKEELSPETARVVFKDNGFKSDSDKTNIKETLKTNGIDEFITI
ncbi:MAG: DNA methylase [Methanobrevibacter sp. CfCl-M3]